MSKFAGYLNYYFRNHADRSGKCVNEKHLLPKVPLFSYSFCSNKVWDVSLPPMIQRLVGNIELLPEFVLSDDFQ